MASLQVVLITLVCALLVACTGVGGQRATPVDARFRVQTDAPVAPDVVMRADAMVKAFQSFLDENKIRRGAIAISYKGDVIDQYGKARSPDEPAKLASLSKSIVALCTLKALEQSNGTVDMTLAEIMPKTLARYPDRNKDMDRITVEQLITHTSGLHVRHTNRMRTDIENMKREQKDLQFEHVVAYGMGAKPGSKFTYANSNYLILGMVIEALTGRSHERFCKQKLLKPVGITTAGVNDDWAFFTSYAGWEMSAVDYVRYINAYYKPHSVLGRPTTDIRTVERGKQEYGLGASMQLTENGWVYWHFGSFLWDTRIVAGRFGAYYAVYDNDYAVAVNYAVDSRNGRARQVREALSNALYK